ncbi:hypothetical protein BGK67_14570 [Streptomyces subrutilus]|uniref:Peptidase S11 D-alanyl-D-alanine carboxypeptidase A N-terminal domain-containing protein n=1 Tax=Streptomyces subrutilus TaxID=36818 RepID=A0A1E5Q2D8_9ACTN|nr:hypothetical protein BGK67_14570 [Streptomyces subrutilus]
MAGESPDKSVDEGTPGAASTSAESDPRLSVFRQRNPDPQAPADTAVDAEPDADGSGGRDPLRDAVAAWVATADEPTADPDADADPEDGPVSRPTGSARPAPADPTPAPTGSASTQPAAPGGASAPAGDQRTTAFRAVEPPAPQPAEPDSAATPARPPHGEAADAPTPGSASAARPTGDAPADAPGAGSPATPERPSRAESADASRASTPASGSASAEGGSAGDERAAASRAAGPASTSGAGAAATPERSAPDEDAGASRAPGSDSASAGDQRTTAFRAVRPPASESAEPGSASAARPTGDAPADAPRATAAPGAGSASAQGGSAGDERGAASGGDQRTAAFRAVKPGGPAAKADDSERTAVFRAVRPAASEAPPAGSASADEPGGGERTAAFRADKPAVGGQPKGAPADEPGDSERTAVFRAVKPAAGEDAPVKEPAPRERTGVFRIPSADAGDSERTATFRAVKPPAPADRPADSASAASPASPAPPAAAPPKASTFVPLRTDEPGQEQPKPKAAAPAAAPAASTPASMDRTERTTQQPLPPRPPLDMLADLTNNPPPPPSPLRTAVRRFKIYFPLVVLLAIILAVVQLVRPLPEPRLVMTAKSSYTFGGAKPELPWPGEGQAYMAAAGLGTLGQSGEQKPVPIASVTKSMTAYIILRDHPIKKGEQGAMIDVDKTAETEGKKNDSVNNESTLDTVKEGDKISEYDAIAALMIPSANNIARLLARWDSGSQEAFVKKMNDTAKELGMANTTYTDPSGLDATTVSTAEDQVKLGLKLVEIETLLDITRKPSWVDPSGKKWDNWNRLVPYNDSLGIKTGTTTKAGGNLLFAAQKKIGNTNQLIVGAVLGQHKPPIIDSVISASKQLMIGTQKALEGAPVVKKGQVVGYVDDGLGGRTPVVATADVQAIGWASLTVNVKLADGGGKIPQTAKAGTEIGVLTVGEGASQVKVPVALQSELASPGLGSKLTRVG